MGRALSIGRTALRRGSSGTFGQPPSAAPAENTNATTTTATTAEQQQPQERSRDERARGLTFSQEMTFFTARQPADTDGREGSSNLPLSTDPEVHDGTPGALLTLTRTPQRRRGGHRRSRGERESFAGESPGYSGGESGGETATSRLQSEGPESAGESATDDNTVVNRQSSPSRHSGGGEQGSGNGNSNTAHRSHSTGSGEARAGSLAGAGTSVNGGGGGMADTYRVVPPPAGSETLASVVVGRPLSVPRLSTRSRSAPRCPLAGQHQSSSRSSSNNNTNANGNGEGGLSSPARGSVPMLPQSNNNSPPSQSNDNADSSAAATTEEVAAAVAAEEALRAAGERIVTNLSTAMPSPLNQPAPMPSLRELAAARVDSSGILLPPAAADIVHRAGIPPDELSAAQIEALMELGSGSASRLQARGVSTTTNNSGSAEQPSSSSATTTSAPAPAALPSLHATEAPPPPTLSQRLAMGAAKRVAELEARAADAAALDDGPRLQPSNGNGNGSSTEGISILERSVRYYDALQTRIDDLRRHATQVRNNTPTANRSPTAVDAAEVQVMTDRMLEAAAAEAAAEFAAEQAAAAAAAAVAEAVVGTETTDDGAGGATTDSTQPPATRAAAEAALAATTQAVVRAEATAREAAARSAAAHNRLRNPLEGTHLDTRMFVHPSGRAALLNACEAALAAAEALIALSVVAAACAVPIDVGGGGSNGGGSSSHARQREEERSSSGRRERLDALRTLSGLYYAAANNTTSTPSGTVSVNGNANGSNSNSATTNTTTTTRGTSTANGGIPIESLPSPAERAAAELARARVAISHLNPSEEEAAEMDYASAADTAAEKLFSMLDLLPSALFSSVHALVFRASIGELTRRLCRGPRAAAAVEKLVERSLSQPQPAARQLAVGMAVLRMPLPQPTRAVWVVVEEAELPP